MIKKKKSNTSMNHKLFCNCYWDSLFMLFLPQSEWIKQIFAFSTIVLQMASGFSLGCYAYLKFLMHLVL